MNSHSARNLGNTYNIADMDEGASEHRVELVLVSDIQSARVQATGDGTSCPTIAFVRYRPQWHIC